MAFYYLLIASAVLENHPEADTDADFLLSLDCFVGDQTFLPHSIICFLLSLDCFAVLEEAEVLPQDSPFLLSLDCFGEGRDQLHCARARLSTIS